MSRPDTSTEYRRRRDSRRTREPGGGGGTGPGREPGFVVRIHDATTHFYFRIEVDGVLRSWSVPKGPSGDPHDKRLATPTEDHHLEYRDFEGTIVEGEYGAGTVIVWAEGSHRNRSTDEHGHEVPFARALAAGHASFRLTGHKSHGDRALTRFREGADGEREAWLLVGHGRTGGDGTFDFRTPLRSTPHRPAQARVRRRPGAGDRRPHRTGGRPGRLRRAAGRSPRGRTTPVRGEGRHRPRRPGAGRALGAPRTGRPDRPHGVDRRRPTAPSPVHGPARRQTAPDVTRERGTS